MVSGWVGGAPTAGRGPWRSTRQKAEGFRDPAQSERGLNQPLSSSGACGWWGSRPTLTGPPGLATPCCCQTAPRHVLALNLSYLFGHSIGSSSAGAGPGRPGIGPAESAPNALELRPRSARLQLRVRGVPTRHPSPAQGPSGSQAWASCFGASDIPMVGILDQVLGNKFPLYD